jgi:hypothetical protein
VPSSPRPISIFQHRVCHCDANAFALNVSRKIAKIRGKAAYFVLREILASI